MTPDPNLDVQLPVHRVCTTSVEVQSTLDGETILFSALGVWADLSRLRNSGAHLGTETTEVPTLRVVHADLLDDKVRIALVVTQQSPADVIIDADGVVTAILAAEPDPSQEFTLVLPTTALALAVALSSTPLGFRIALIDGEPPEYPEFTAIPVQALSAVLMVDPDAVHDALHGVVNDALHKPLLDSDDEDEDDEMSAVIENTRRMLWPVIAGVSLGQVPAYNRLHALSEWAQTLDDTPDSEEGNRLLALFEVADVALGFSAHYLADHTGLDDPAFGQISGKMTALAQRIVDSVDEDAYHALAQGTPISAVAATAGIERALPAFAVLLAARAHAISLTDEHAGASTSFIVGSWMSSPHEPLTWTMPASGSLLAHHDVDVMSDLLAVTDDEQDASDLLFNYLHTLTDALHNADLDADDLRVNIAACDIKPVNFGDIQILAEALLREAAEAADRHDDQCPPCTSVRSFLEISGWDVPRIARAATALLPILADLDADVNGHEIGDEEWVAHRSQYLAHWLNEAAA